MRLGGATPLPPTSAKRAQAAALSGRLGLGTPGGGDALDALHNVTPSRPGGARLAAASLFGVLSGQGGR